MMVVIAVILVSENEKSSKIRAVILVYVNEKSSKICDTMVKIPASFPANPQLSWPPPPLLSDRERTSAEPRRAPCVGPRLWPHLPPLGALVVPAAARGPRPRAASSLLSPAAGCGRWSQDHREHGQGRLWKSFYGLNEGSVVGLSWSWYVTGSWNEFSLIICTAFEYLLLCLPDCLEKLWLFSFLLYSDRF